MVDPSGAKGVLNLNDKLMIIGKTAKSAADWLPKFKKEKFNTKITHVGQHTISNIFEAAVVVCDDQDDLDMMIDMLVRFETCPVVAFVGDIALPADFKNCRVFGKAKVKDCAKHLHDKIAEVKTEIDKVFTSFDKDNSGVIDKNELKEVAKELGLEMGMADINNMMEELDSDLNGVIDK